MPRPTIHENTLARLTRLSQYWQPDMITPLEVIAVLNDASIPFVLVGAFGIAVWMKESRSTYDVDIIVPCEDLKKATEIFLATFPNLECSAEEPAIRFRKKDKEQEAIDLMKPVQPYLTAALKNTKRIECDNQCYRVPSLEMAITLKYVPLIRSVPMHEKYRHAADFIQMATYNENINEQKLAQLGELVYPGGGKEILEFVRQTLAGEQLKL